MTDSRSKGARFERAIANIFTKAYDTNFRRTPLSGGWAKDAPIAAGDIVCTDEDFEFPYSVECKCQEGWRLVSLFDGNVTWLEDWWRQTVSECPSGKLPLLVFSKNYTPTLAIMRSTDVLDLTGPSFNLRLLGDNVVIFRFDEIFDWGR